MREREAVALLREALLYLIGVKKDNPVKRIQAFLLALTLSGCGMMQSLPDAEALYRECLTMRGSADVTVSVGSGIFTPSRLIRSSCSNDEAIAASFRQPIKRARGE